VLPLLAVLGLGLTVYLVRRAPRELRTAVLAGWNRRELARIALQALLVGAVLGAGVAWIEPERLFDLPRRHPRAWLALLVAYPLLSVIPQEILFRVFFFHRYGPLWSRASTRILVSAVAFGLAHLLYGSWLTVLLAALGGLFFSWTFVRTRSLPLVVLEHSLYGVLLFTIGLGRHFQVEPWS